MNKQDQELTIRHLRMASLKSSIRAQCIKENRKKFLTGLHKNGKTKSVFKVQCQTCKEWFRTDEIEVDHRVEIGPFEGDWNKYIDKMIPDTTENLQTLCIICHKKKTAFFNRRYVDEEL